MKEWLVRITEPTVVIIDGIALLVVVIGTIETLIRAMPAMLSSPSGQQRRDIWLRYARWLVAALTFQLAADIIETSIGMGWEDIARLGAIALIRTFLDYFLERDLAETRERQQNT
jgi:uncharacterized membrane protein